MLRFIGLLLIGVACCLAGKVRADRVYQELEHQACLLHLFREIKRSALCYRKPIEEVVRQFRALSKSRFEFLEDATVTSLATSYERHRRCFGYDAFTDQRISGYLSSFGGFSLSEALLECDRLIESLGEIWEDRKATLANQQRLYLTLGITVGLGLIIVFV